MNIIKEYFSNLIFKKVKNRDAYSVYISRLSTHLGSSEKYIILHVPREISINNTGTIKNLHWNVLYCLVCDNPPNSSYIIEKQRFIPKYLYTVATATPTSQHQHYYYDTKLVMKDERYHNNRNAVVYTTQYDHSLIAVLNSECHLSLVELLDNIFMVQPIFYRVAIK